MSLYNKNLGKTGEEIVCKYLKEKGFLILDKNAYFWGGEIDIVASKDETIHFVEVKTRMDHHDLDITELLSSAKLKSLLRSVRLYLYKKNFEDIYAQIDLVLVRFNKDRTYKLEYLENITF